MYLVCTGGHVLETYGGRKITLLAAWETVCTTERTLVPGLPHWMSNIVFYWFAVGPYNEFPYLLRAAEHLIARNHMAIL